MKMLPTPLRHVVLAGTLLGVGCMGRAGDAAAPPAPGAPRSARLLDTVKSLVGDAGCDQATQCRVIGVGARPCGGPAGYLAWSTRITDPAALAAAVAAQGGAEAAENEARGRVSDCRVVREPGVACRPRAEGDPDKTCQLVPGAARSPV